VLTACMRAQETPAERVDEVADAPLVGAFLRNQEANARALRFVLGVFPVPHDNAWESRAVSVVSHLQRVFSCEPLPTAVAAAVSGACLPTYTKARETEFSPRRGLGFKSFPGDRARYEAWRRHEDGGGERVFVFACFESGMHSDGGAESSSTGYE
jgi:hypothetical protein